MSIAVVGAGVTGATIARLLSQEGRQVDVFEKRPHVGGHCHTEIDPETGIMVHKYGPHIFHTNDVEVWTFVNKFAEFKPFSLRMKAIARGKAHSFPINLLTMSEIFGTAFTPRSGEAWLRSVVKTENLDTFEGHALATVGSTLYRTFLYGYTKKQWGMDPIHLPSSIVKRLPLRFNYDDRAHDHRFQGIPERGYTALCADLLSCPGVNVYLRAKFKPSAVEEYDHVFYTGPIDAFFKYVAGPLPYRTLDFETERYDGDYQGAAVISYCDYSVPYTRVIEHKHFTPHKQFDRTIIHREYPRDCDMSKGDEPFYPVRGLGGSERLETYERLAAEQKKVTFVGRLAMFRYLDMDWAIKEAMNCVTRYLNH